MYKESRMVACIALVMAGLVLVGCGSSESNSSSSVGVDRQASSSESVGICIGDRPWDRVDGATVTYRRGVSGAETGPFPLAGNWCDVAPSLNLRSTILLADGTLLAGFRMIPFGYMVAVDCGGGGKSYNYDAYLKVGVPIDHTCGLWKVSLVREPDTRSSDGGSQLNYQVWVSSA